MQIAERGWKLYPGANRSLKTYDLYPEFRRFCLIWGANKPRFAPGYNFHPLSAIYTLATFGMEQVPWLRSRAKD